MFFEEEPAHIKEARQAPLRSTWESRNPPGPLKKDEGHSQAATKADTKGAIS